MITSICGAEKLKINKCSVLQAQWQAQAWQQMSYLQGSWYARKGSSVAHAAAGDGKPREHSDVHGAEDAERDFEEQLAAQEEWEIEQLELAMRMQACSVY
jgi:hypothetical protein